MKITYLIALFLEQMILLSGAVLIPIYITPGYYWWSAFALIVYFVTANAANSRLN